MSLYLTQSNFLCHVITVTEVLNCFNKLSNVIIKEKQSIVKGKPFYCIYYHINGNTTSNSLSSAVKVAKFLLLNCLCFTQNIVAIPFFVRGGGVLYNGIFFHFIHFTVHNINKFKSCHFDIIKHFLIPLCIVVITR